MAKVESVPPSRSKREHVGGGRAAALLQQREGAAASSTSKTTEPTPSGWTRSQRAARPPSPTGRRAEDADVAGLEERRALPPGPLQLGAAHRHLGEVEPLPVEAAAPLQVVDVVVERLQPDQADGLERRGGHVGLPAGARRRRRRARARAGRVRLPVGVRRLEGREGGAGGLDAEQRREAGRLHAEAARAVELRAPGSSRPAPGASPWQKRPAPPSPTAASSAGQARRRWRAAPTSGPSPAPSRAASFSTMAFCIGWMPELTCSARARTRARPSAVRRQERRRRVHARRATRGWPSTGPAGAAAGRPPATSSTGTWWVGLRAPCSGRHCSPGQQVDRRVLRSEAP